MTLTDSNSYTNTAASIKQTTKHDPNRNSIDCVFLAICSCTSLQPVPENHMVQDSNLLEFYSLPTEGSGPQPALRQELGPPQAGDPPSRRRKSLSLPAPATRSTRTRSDKDIQNTHTKSGCRALQFRRLMLCFISHHLSWKTTFVEVSHTAIAVYPFCSSAVVRQVHKQKKQTDDDVHLLRTGQRLDIQQNSNHRNLRTIYTDEEVSKFMTA